MNGPTDSASQAWPDWPLGAHLVTPRRGYEHHGIYVGAGRVVHYAGWSRALLRGPIEEVALAAFAGGRPVQLRPHVDPRFAPAAVVARARSRLGEDRYRLATNNCEHFSLWCVSGESRSTQVEAWRDGMRSVWQTLRRLLGALAARPGSAAISPRARA